MTEKIHTLLVCGGGSSEHEVSLRTADFIAQQLQADDIALRRVEMTADGRLLDAGQKEWLLQHGVLRANDGADNWPVHCVVPSIHGYPGETGDFQSALEMQGVPYFGCGPEASKICFNKVTSKLWFTALGVPNTPYEFITGLDKTDFDKAREALARWGTIFVKASNQGSSVGCYKVSDGGELDKALREAFSYSPFVLIEQAVRARELEVAVYEYKGAIHATPPGEILAPADTFYTYEEKYSEGSHSSTQVMAEGLSQKQLDAIEAYSYRVFESLKLKDLSRVDFFLTEDGDIYLNEINTFPGMTPISMFPKMVMNAGTDYSDYLCSQVRRLARAQ
ncbi:D-alanine--D-alanine ligase [Biformimicrobium ophioploci]|uniref:D-alanine--D-alanine ligase n=1 Tax=Biformimicrobium ophioploci TaxID=3036711 RepID=A0ABQ6LY55_9GAMM|nr:D-alanine--D-alanine ligase [Microbulbifer sp. NKW57]GMG87032.1 D-alanine--D-alanine ligase [Microbulbifer sp. NKW57]